MGLVHKHFRVVSKLTSETTGKPLLPFGARTARRLMAIANELVFKNLTHGSDLPPSCRTFYELTKLPMSGSLSNAGACS